ncbi:hypothetical protein [Flammeovirga aprica]|uniref:Uncharacterized protein n=1 Tax=Flammeovirga aprica JL-4 TaxID=694437 RepID=A0A7X9RVQ7_9BACT|nr:hypothetical protein [Flammeovirga aprica]NME69592.1 hypothetical protein [Flammeovirga aprica JL-4]
MKYYLQTLALSIAFGFTLCLTGCQLQEDDENLIDKESQMSETEQDTFQENTEARTIYNNVDAIADKALAALDASSQRLASATNEITDSGIAGWDILTLNPHVFVRTDTVVIDFDKIDSKDYNPNYECSGKVIVHRKDTLREFSVTFSHTVTFENYTVNNVKVEGVRTRLMEKELSGWTGIGEINSLAFEVKTEGGKMTYPDGTIHTRNSSETITVDFPITLSPEFVVSNLESNGITRSGNAYSGKSISDLIVKENVARIWYISEGEMAYNTDNIDFTVDYDTGKSSTALFKKDGFSFEFVINWLSFEVEGLNN